MRNSIYHLTSAMTTFGVVALIVLQAFNLTAQCGFSATCSNTNYLNFGMGSNADGTTI